MPNARQTSLIASPSSSQATNRRRSSITEHSFHGIHASPGKGKVLPMCPVRSVTYVSGRSPRKHQSISGGLLALVRSLCAYDLVGFQTQQDLDGFHPKILDFGLGADAKRSATGNSRVASCRLN